MRTLLLHPPQQTFYGPHLALPSLAAFLRVHGAEVRVRDLNQETNRALLTAEWLARAVARAVARPEIAGEPAVVRAREAQPRVTKALPSALATLGDAGALHDDTRLADAFGVLSEAYAVLSSGWYPTELSYGLHTRRPVTDFASLDALLDDPAENPWLEVFPETVLPSLLRSLSEDQPELVGIGLTYEDQLLAGLTLARQLRAARPELPLVMGGALVSRMLPAFERRQALLDPFDWAVVFEGETALLRLAACLAEGRLPGDGLPNLLRRHSSGLRLGPRHVEDLASLPTPDFSDLALDGYLLPAPVLPLLTSRGCYWGRCAFCAHHQGYGDAGTVAKRFRSRPAARIAEDLDTIARRHGPQALYLVDEAISPKNLRVVAEHVRAAGLGHTWFGDVRFERNLTAERLSLLREGGCSLLIFGLESGCQRVLDHMDKGVRLEDAARILHDATAAGIFTVVMVFVGFPSETVPEAQATAAFLARHEADIGAWGVGAFSLLEGAPAFVEPRRFGITQVAGAPDDDLGNVYGYQVMRGLDAASASRIAASLSRRSGGTPGRSFPRELTALRAHVRPVDGTSAP